ncbi:universal stress protein [Methanosphaerula palustris]|uniref:UspA domain protein n=1 Tax=Methanosphaerula palustris (strain ATCC BAA-1556 / DSM 19958 / E1-9c) TaxID=521011 RepID=B8GHB8_METPE|nr:universal stress protein [Methanosphaerula palustris]ACL16523.1 UspA domain protein [Methanosphaerula palustris E1-9c]
MTLFKKILIATDGSENNQTAVETGIEIAQACGSNVYVVYVIDMRTFESLPADVGMRDTYLLLQNEANTVLDRVRKLGGDLALETKILEGRPATEIVEFAAENSIDLIVIGTQGKTGIKRLLLGSVAETVIRSATSKVLVVKNNPITET